MKKVMILWVELLITAMLVAACGNDDLMKNYTTLGRDFTEKIFAEDYDGAEAYIDETMKPAINTDALENIVETTQAKYGDFQQIEAVTEVSLSDYLALLEITDDGTYSDNDYKVIAVTVAFADSEMNFYLTFQSGARTIVNISVYGQEEKEGGLSEDAMREQARTFLNHVFGGDDAAAYDMMNVALQSEMDQSGLAALVTEAASRYGDFDAVENILVTGSDVIAFVSFGEGEVKAYLSFDGDGKISAFYTGDVNE